MFARLGRFTVRRRRPVMAAAVVFFALAGVLGGGVAGELSSGGFEDPGSESTQASQLLEQRFGAGDPNLVVLVTARGGDVDSAAVAAEGRRITESLAADPGIDQAVSYWTLGNAPPLKGDDGRRALVLARIAGGEDEVDSWIEEHHDAIAADTDVVTVGVGGFAEVFREVGTTIESDLARAEAIALPVTLLLLVFVFGSVVAAGLPVGIGVLAILGTFLVLFVIAQVTQVSIFALNLTTAMGLGLSIDYGLFVVTRFREELAAGRSVEDAVVRTEMTAGRTVVFSAATVAASLAALLLFPLAFLRSFAYAGIAVVAVAALASVVVLPAVLATLGRRVDRWSVRRAAGGPGTFWRRAATTVMAHPWPFAVGVTALLLALGVPFLRVELGLPDDRVLPTSADSRRVHDEIREHFSTTEAGAMAVVASGIGDPSARVAEIDSYATELSKLEGVSRVDASTGFYVDGQRIPPGDLNRRFVADDSVFLSVVPEVEPVSAEGEALARQVRDVPAPFPVVVSGLSAELADVKDAVLGRVPAAFGLIALVTFVVLFLMFGSVLVPLKALVLNLLSLTATFGAMVWVFQDGHFAGILGFTATGTIDITTPVLMFCIAFGLSMDYEVFLLSRIKEEYDRTGDNEAAVAWGLERTGRIITAAAALLAIVFVAMTTSRVMFIKLFGLGLTMAVLVDATLVRATLVPAFMRLAGRANWWAPRFLRVVHDRYGISEAEPVAAPVPEAVPDLEAAR